MRVLGARLQVHLDSGTTTLCACWKLTLRSGETLGFTDHDEAVVIDGMSFEAEAGFSASEIHASLGFAVDNLEASGALQSGRLDETRLKQGDYDHAAIEIWRVNWQDASQRLLLRKGHLGEVSYGQGHFKAEVRGLAHILNQPKGRLFQFGCDAELGDARCGANIASATYRGVGTVTAVRDSSIDVSGLSGFADDWFTRGVLTINGKALSVKRHRALATRARVDFWQAPKFTIVLGDAISVTAGCDKQFSTCKSKFGNGANFRGFPHMSGSDFVMAVASSAGTNNGASRNS
ncbi:MAG: DUF2163 domain-containing protein [Alphaproteobacteria bacterium]|nr:DUF2163 domain-containing protein [Alphaproteobacteria bacterium]